MQTYNFVEKKFNKEFYLPNSELRFRGIEKNQPLLWDLPSGAIFIKGQNHRDIQTFFKGGLEVVSDEKAPVNQRISKDNNKYTLNIRVRHTDSQLKNYTQQFKSNHPQIQWISRKELYYMYCEYANKMQFFQASKRRIYNFFRLVYIERYRNAIIGFELREKVKSEKLHKGYLKYILASFSTDYFQPYRNLKPNPIKGSASVRQMKACWQSLGDEVVQNGLKGIRLR